MPIKVINVRHPEPPSHTMTTSHPGLERLTPRYQGALCRTVESLRRTQSPDSGLVEGHLSRWLQSQSTKLSISCTAKLALSVLAPCPLRKDQFRAHIELQLLLNSFLPLDLQLRLGTPALDSFRTAFTF